MPECLRLNFVRPMVNLGFFVCLFLYESGKVALSTKKCLAVGCSQKDCRQLIDFSYPGTGAGS